jgi:hypothetical protein
MKKRVTNYKGKKSVLDICYIKIYKLKKLFHLLEISEEREKDD